MTSDDIKSVICMWLNSLGYKAIKAPSNNPAPAGRHIALNLTSTRQWGDMLIPGPRRDEKSPKKHKAVMQVSQVQLYEVEGDGDWLRDIRNRIVDGQLGRYVSGQFKSTEDGRDTGFSVWEIGDIVDNGMQDGAYWIDQKTMTFDVQFNDYLEHDALSILSVSGTANGEDFSVSVSDGQ